MVSTFAKFARIDNKKEERFIRKYPGFSYSAQYQNDITRTLIALKEDLMAIIGRF